MAKTIQQAGGNTGNSPIQTSQAVTSTTGVAPTKTQTGDMLAKDIFNILGSTGGLVEEGYDVSTKAARRVASDNLTMLGLGMEEIKKNTNYNDAKSIRKAEEANTALYQTLGRRNFENTDAQDDFDNSFHTSGATTVATMNTSLRHKALKIDADDNVKKVTNDIQIQANAHIKQTPDMYNGYIETITAGGYYTRLQAENIVSKISIQSLQGDYETLKDMPIYNDDNTINMETASKLYNNRFETQSKMVYNKDKEGGAGWEVIGVGKTDSKIIDA